MQPVPTESTTQQAAGASTGAGRERQLRRALPHGTGPFIGLVLLCLAARHSRTSPMNGPVPCGSARLSWRSRPAPVLAPAACWVVDSVGTGCMGDQCLFIHVVG